MYLIVEGSTGGRSPAVGGSVSASAIMHINSWSKISELEMAVQVGDYEERCRYGGIPPGGQRWQHPPHNQLTMHQATFMWTLVRTYRPVQGQALVVFQSAYILLLCNSYLATSLEMIGGVLAVAQLLTAMAGLTSVAWVGVGKGWHGRMWKSSRSAARATA